MKLKESIKFAAPEKSLFFPTLKSRVDSYFKEKNISRNADSRMVVKTVVLVSSYLLPFLGILLLTPPVWVALILWFVMGMAISGIGMSVMHDANHGAFSKNPTINKWLGNIMINIAGAGVMNWKWQHNILHHTYTNVAEMDEDIRDRGVIKLSPHSTAHGIHRFQWIYAFFFYGILTLYWVLAKDFLQYYTFIKTGVNKQTSLENRKMLLGLINIKLIYLTVFLVLPVVVFDIPFLQIFSGFLLMHFTAGIVLTVIFQLAHSVEGTTYPLANDKGVIEKDWAIHQLETTVNFSPGNKFLTWYSGGLNFQIEHHLFPKICHIHYPGLAPIVKNTAKEFGLNYLENKTFLEALKSHASSLKRFGSPGFNDAIG